MEDIDDSRPRTPHLAWWVEAHTDGVVEKNAKAFYIIYIKQLTKLTFGFIILEH